MPSDLRENLLSTAPVLVLFTPQHNCWFIGGFLLLVHKLRWGHNLVCMLSTWYSSRHTRDAQQMLERSGLGERYAWLYPGAILVSVMYIHASQIPVTSSVFISMWTFARRSHPLILMDHHKYIYNIIEWRNYEAHYLFHCSPRNLMQ